MKVLFRETQKFRQTWMWILLVGITLIPFYGMYKQFILGDKFGSNPMSNLMLIGFATFMALLNALFLILRLDTEITDECIRVRFFPFVNKSINWTDIDKAKVIDHRIVGGWGIRKTTKSGTVYNVSGKHGLALVLKKGKKLIIGSQKWRELDQVIKSMDQSH